MQNIPCKLSVENIRNIVATRYIMEMPSSTLLGEQIAPELA